MEKESYKDMVFRLKKPADDIKKHLTNKDIDDLHMIVGLVGELTELSVEINEEAISKGKILKELGDCQYYFTGLSLPEPSREDSGLIKNLIEISGGLLCPNEIILIALQEAGNVLDTFKKTVFLNKTLSTTELQTLRFKYWSVGLGLNMLANVYGSSIEEVERINQEKLSTGANARYKDGYSDKAAALRTDVIG